MFEIECMVPKCFWAQAVSMACYLINKSPRASLGGKVAEEVWTGNAVDFSHEYLVVLLMCRCLVMRDRNLM